MQGMAVSLLPLPAWTAMLSRPVCLHLDRPPKALRVPAAPTKLHKKKENKHSKGRDEVDRSFLEAQVGCRPHTCSLRASLLESWDCQANHACMLF